MKMFQSRSAIALAAVAALSMTATPAMARGWYRGHHHHDRIDAGDIFAGILIIGGIAAIASAASKSDREKRDEADNRDYRRPSDEDYRDYRDYRDRNGGYGDYRDGRNDRYGATPQASGIDGAVESCIAEVERGEHRVDDVDSVSREGEGWRVEGRLRNEGEFSCSVDVDGRIRRATVDGRAVI